jgi:predicted dehydrogenase
LGDLGAHIIDLARYLVGEVSEVSALTETFIKERPTGAMTGGLGAAKTGQKGKVTVDDCALFITRFSNGAVGSFEATRFAGGRKNYNRFEINGSGGSVAFNLERLNELEYFNRNDPADRQGFRDIICNEGSQPYGANWWPSGHIIGYEHTFVNTVADVMQALAHNQPFAPDFVDGARNQAVLDAVERAAKSKQWEKVAKV